MTADSQETVGEQAPATQAIDGNRGSIWHTQWQGSRTPLPHTLTIDTAATQQVSELGYLPRQDGLLNGTITRYRVSTSLDAATWTVVAEGTWTGDGAAKTATFASTSARYVRLTALAEASGTGPWASAAEVTLSGRPARSDASVLGSWGPTITFPLVPVAVAVLPGNRLLTWSANAPDSFGGRGQTQTAILDLTTGAVSARTVTETGHDMFCPGVVVLADGRIMVTGGDDDTKTSIFDPATNAWTAGPPMRIPRGYQAMTLLPSGEAFTVGGSWMNQNRGGKIGEVFSTSTGWRTLPGVGTDAMVTADAGGIFRAENHMWLFPTSDGRVLQMGPSKQMNLISVNGNGSVTPAGTRADAPDQMNGNAVMYDAGKVLTVGGSPSYEQSDATAKAYTVDMSGSLPVTRATGSMQTPRRWTGRGVRGSCSGPGGSAGRRRRPARTRPR